MYGIAYDDSIAYQNNDKGTKVALAQAEKAKVHGTRECNRVQLRHDDGSGRRRACRARRPPHVPRQVRCKAPLREMRSPTTRERRGIRSQAFSGGGLAAYGSMHGTLAGSGTVVRETAQRRNSLQGVP